MPVPGRARAEAGFGIQTTLMKIQIIIEELADWAIRMGCQSEDLSSESEGEAAEREKELEEQERAEAVATAAG